MREMPQAWSTLAVGRPGPRPHPHPHPLPWGQELKGLGPWARKTFARCLPPWLGRGSLVVQGGETVGARLGGRGWHLGPSGPGTERGRQGRT